MLFYDDLPNLKLKFISACGYFAFFKRLFKFAFLGANFAVFGIKFSSFQLTLVSSCGFACISLADAPPLLFQSRASAELLSRSNLLASMPSGVFRRSFRACAPSTKFYRLKFCLPTNRMSARFLYWWFAFGYFRRDCSAFTSRLLRQILKYLPRKARLFAWTPIPVSALKNLSKSPATRLPQSSSSPSSHA